MITDFTQIDFYLIYGIFLAAAIISLSEAVYDFTEGLPPFQVCADVTNNVLIEVELELNVQTMPGSADDSDFEAVNMNISVNNSTCFEIIVFSDDFLEDSEMFTVVIGSRDSRLVLSLFQADVRIRDSNRESNISYYFPILLLLFINHVNRCSCQVYKFYLYSN